MGEKYFRRLVADRPVGIHTHLVAGKALGADDHPSNFAFIIKAVPNGQVELLFPTGTLRISGISVVPVFFAVSNEHRLLAASADSLRYAVFLAALHPKRGAFTRCANRLFHKTCWVAFSVSKLTDKHHQLIELRRHSEIVRARSWDSVNRKGNHSMKVTAGCGDTPIPQPAG